MLEIAFEQVELPFYALEPKHRVFLHAVLHPVEGSVKEAPELVRADSPGTTVGAIGEIRSNETVTGTAGRELAHGSLYPATAGLFNPVWSGAEIVGGPQDRGSGGRDGSWIGHTGRINNIGTTF